MLLRMAELLPLLVEYLSGDLYASITGTLNNFTVRKYDSGGVKGVADLVDHADIVLGPIDPAIFLLDKKPFVYAAI